MLLRERKQEMMEQLRCFTWHVRQQKNWCGGYEYAIEIDGLDGLISYGDTYREAKEGLIESVFYWLRHRKLESLPERKKSSTHLIHIYTAMTEEEFEQINFLIRKW